MFKGEPKKIYFGCVLWVLCPLRMWRQLLLLKKFCFLLPGKRIAVRKFSRHIGGAERRPGEGGMLGGADLGAEPCGSDTICYPKIVGLKL